MYKNVICILIMLTLTSCSFFQIRKRVIEQGNIYTPQMVSQLHPGMSQGQVRQIMGNPVLQNIFTPGHIEYVYTYQDRNAPRLEKRVVCTFRNGVLTNIYQTNT